MKRHIYILLMVVIPLLAQKPNRGVSRSNTSANPEALIEQVATVSVPRRISYQGIPVSYTHLTLPTTPYV